MSAPRALGRNVGIVGGGLAGLALGVALRRAKIPVTLHDAGSYPRHRVCGEFITGLAPSTIERLGLAPVLADALLHREVAWFAGTGPPNIQQLPHPALGLSRHTLDARLARTFVALGGRLCTRSRITDSVNLPGRVLATGRPRQNRSPWLGLKIHARALPLERDLEMHLGHGAYVGLARVEDGRVNLCGLFRRRAAAGRGVPLLLAYLRAAGLEALASRLAAGRPDPESFCAVAALAFDRRVRSENGLRIGDAAATIPPFTGNGMAMALQSAELALAPVIAFARGEISWEEACRVAQATQHRRFRARLASAQLLHPFLLQPWRQRLVAALGRAHLLPFRPLYASLH